MFNPSSLWDLSRSGNVTIHMYLILYFIYLMSLIMAPLIYTCLSELSQICLWDFLKRDSVLSVKMFYLVVHFVGLLLYVVKKKCKNQSLHLIVKSFHITAIFLSRIRQLIFSGNPTLLGLSVNYWGVFTMGNLNWLLRCKKEDQKRDRKES